MVCIDSRDRTSFTSLYKNDVIISYEGEDDIKEKEANEFARDFFINPEKYEQFCKKNKISAETIKLFAKEQGTIPEFVVARLQHDKKIGFDQFNYCIR